MRCCSLLSYPQLFPEDGVQAAAFGAATAELMAKSAQTLCNVVGVTPSQESLAMLASEAQIESICYFTFSLASMGCVWCQWWSLRL